MTHSRYARVLPCRQGERSVLALEVRDFMVVRRGLAAIGIAMAGMSALPAIAAQNWDLVWADEFNGTSLDRTKWAPEESCIGGGNRERQCYTSRRENIEIAGGLLHLIAREEAFTGPGAPAEWRMVPNPDITQPYTSGKIRTRGLADWTYGKFEARMKLPAGQGTWPAFWMMPIDDEYGSWPLSGEIDIMEAINLGARCEECEGGRENRTQGALHFGGARPKNDSTSAKAAFGDGRLPSDDFHVYGVEWGQGIIHWTIDGQRFFTATKDDWYTLSPLARGNPDAPFDRSFYLMLNLAIGGVFPEPLNDGGIDPEAVPAALLVDWVRVHQCTEDRETGLACMTP